ncbi:MAG TPA: hypothetical protein DCG18_02835 [Richelia sp.]|nr:hypothetical protein [Richelia sp.]
MFLYLSKLLPLLFYPLGFACINLFIALVLLAKKPKTSAFFIVFSLILLLVTSNAWISHLVVQSLEWQNLGVADLPAADAIVVLGGGTKSATFPRPGVDLAEQGDRIIYAAQLYRQKKAPTIILSGGRLDWHESITPESTDMAVVLNSFGVPQKAIIEEPNSLNTYQNARNVRKIADKNGIKKIILITSAVHMPRSLLIFKRQGMNVIPAPTDFLVSEEKIRGLGITPKAAILSLIPDVNNLHELTLALKEYLGILIYYLQGWL